MKYTSLTFKFLMVFLVFGLISCSNPDNSDKLSSDLVNNPNSASGKKRSNVPEITFESTTHDFGIIMEGEKVPWIFKFENTGGADLIISSVAATCGCTATKWSKKPIPPGGKGQIEVTFDSDNKPGPNRKNVKIMTNTTPNRTELTIIAEVYKQKK